MKRILQTDEKTLFLILLALAPQSVTAQDAKTAIVAEKVTYSRAVPKGLSAFVPRGGKSRFWGATKLQWEGKPVWVHVYDVRKMGSSSVQKSGLDLFVFTKSDSLKRLSSTPFNYSRDGDYRQEGAFKTIGVGTLWLDFQTKKIPVLKLDLRSPGSGFGEDGVDVLSIFSNGQNKVATIEILKCGWDSSSDRNGWQSDYQRGSDGQLQVIFTHSSFYGKEIQTLEWDGKKFTLTNTKVEKRME